MKLGIGAVPFGPKVSINLDLIRRAEELGFDSAWTAEAYGNDAVSTATWVLAKTSRINVGTAIMQMPARTPAMAAMTAMTLDDLSGGRFILGLGPSGPQVVEGWHGVPYCEPLKSILHGNPTLPIYTASISPAGLRCAAEVADGVFPMMLDPEKFDVAYLPYLEDGFAAAGTGKSLANFAVVPGVSVIVTDEPEKARMVVKGGMALYIGGMGARGKNFYNDLAKRLGYEAAAVRIQDLFLAGKKAEAAAAVPDELLDAVHLIGSADRMRGQLAAWKEAGRKGWVHTMQIATAQPAALELLAEELL